MSQTKSHVSCPTSCNLKRLDGGLLKAWLHTDMGNSTTWSDHSPKHNA